MSVPFSTSLLDFFPPVTLVPKRSAEDTILRTVNRKGEAIAIPVPKGTNVNVLTVALHRNRKFLSSVLNIANLIFSKILAQPG
ncbi:hypothetical protein CPB86DRAFT_520543 [Serendipita vermifera]|nr:hypothetical protein CPB86DRAFT_520543 [Serendipita vermifera]